MWFKGPLSGLRQFLTIESPLKIMKNTFYVKNTFLSRDVYIFALTFRLCRKMAWWESCLVSKFITSQTGKQVITIHILPNISRSKGNQAIRLDQLLKYSLRYTFHQKSWRKWCSKTSSRPLSVFWKSFT